MSHSPPVRVRDETARVEPVGSGRHVGSPVLRAYIERHAPRLVVCGHIHEAAGVEGLGTTLVINAARAAVLLDMDAAAVADGEIGWEVVKHHGWSGPTRGRCEPDAETPPLTTPG